MIGLASALGRHNGFVHADGGRAHLVVPRRAGIVIGAGFVAGLAVVAIVDVATMGIAEPIVLKSAVGGPLVGLVSIEVCVWLVGAELLLHMAPGLMLPASAASATASVAASASLALMLVLHWLLELCQLLEWH